MAHIQRLNEHLNGSETYVKGFEKLNKEEIRILEKIAKTSSMDRWFSITDDVRIFDLQAGKEVSLTHGIGMLVDGMSEADFGVLTEKEKFLFVRMLGKLADQ